MKTFKNFIDVKRKGIAKSAYECGHKRQAELHQQYGGNASAADEAHKHVMSMDPSGPSEYYHAKSHYLQGVRDAALKHYEDHRKKEDG